MTTETSQELPGLQGIPPDDLARLQMAAARERRNKLLLAALVTVIGIGASAMSCVGQSFGYRQARALESIDQQLREIVRALPPAGQEPPRTDPHEPPCGAAGLQRDASLPVAEGRYP